MRFILVTLLFLCCALANAADSGVMPALGHLSHPEPTRYAAGAVEAGDVEALAAAGIRDVVNLRTAQETPDFDEAAAVTAAGMRYHALPIGGAADLTRDNVVRLDAMLAAAGTEPVLVHCASSNRVGAMMALRAAWIDGKPVDEAVAIGQQWGLASLESVVRQKLAEPVAPVDAAR